MEHVGRLDAAHVAAALGGAKRVSGGWIACCPVHDDRSPSLKLIDAEAGGVVAHCFAGCDWREVQAALAALGLVPGRNKAWRPDPAAAARRVDRARQEKRSQVKRTDAARRLISASIPAAGTLAEQYLNSRAVLLPASAPLLFAAKCWHWPSNTAHPAMIAPIVPVQTNENTSPQAAHITFLEQGGGKAGVAPVRLYLGPKSGGTVKLAPDDAVTDGLAIAEGVETALCGLMAGIPTWATLDAGNLAAFPVLPGIDSLTVIADHDAAGIAAAESVAKRWRDVGREVRVILAENIGDDLNDIAREIADG